MKVSAVVPTYNDEDVIKECLESLLKQTVRFNEIIVVDNASSDKTREIVESFPVKKIFLPKNMERCYSRNVGWENAEEEIVAFIESDSVYDKDWVRNVLKEFEKGATAVINRRRVYMPNSFISKFIDEMFKIRMQKDKYEPFAAWIFRKEVLKNLEGFDETQAGVEDLELGTRLINNGIKISYADKAIEYHKGEATTFIQSLKKAWWFGLQVQKYYKKYPEKIPYLKFGAFTLLTFFLITNLKFLIISVVILYIGLLARILHRGLGFKYAIVYPLLTILGSWVFFFAFVYSLIERAFPRTNLLKRSLLSL